jgi:ComF family protein
MAFDPSRPWRLLSQGGAALLSLFYPAHCAACGCRLPEGELRKDDRGNAEEVICEECRKGILPPPEHCCPICSHPMAGLFLCPNCDGRRWHLSVIVAACRYEGLVRELIQRFKYGKDQSLVRLLGNQLVKALEDPRLQGKKFDAIVPVPLHSLKEREREFNQSELLANRLGKKLGIPVMHALKRIRSTAPQAGFDRARRMENLEGAFAIASSAAKAQKGSWQQDATILLVDDVTTTGTTLDACAAILMEEGAAEVCAVTIARG